MRSRFLSCLPLIALLLTTPALADDCNKPLKLVTTLPLTDASGGRFNIPVTLNGVEKHFLFDTGGFFSQVSPSVANELKLQPHTPLDVNFELYGVDGSVSRSMVRIPSFAIGALHTTNYDLPLGTDDNIDGIFSPIAYKNFDFEMDFSSRKINLFLNDHCDGRVIYWPAKAIAVVPVNVSDLHLTVPVTIDGHKLTAIIDTGASTSTVRLDVAKYVFSLNPESDDMKIIGHIGGDEKAPIYQHHFQTMSFEGISVLNPKIEILTDIVNKNADHSLQTGSHIKTVSDDLKLPEVIIGMDVLQRLHIYLALTEKRLYMTEAGAPAAPAPAQ